MILPALIDLNHIELNHYPFLISLDKCDVSFNVADDSSNRNMCSEWKCVNVKVFNIITKNKWIRNVGKTYFMWLLKKHLIVQHVIQIKNEIMINISV